jgi:hypothetical protein
MVKREIAIKSGPDQARSEPLFVYVFWDRDSLPGPARAVKVVRLVYNIGKIHPYGRVH